MTEAFGNREQNMLLFRKPVRRVEAAQVVREATTGRVVSVAPQVTARPRPVLLRKVWAVAEDPVRAGVPKAGLGATNLLLLRARHPGPAVEAGSGVDEASEAESQGELAFYRRYTEAMLRRYLRLSMAAGRVPSLLGRELFRGHVTSYRVQSFEDVVIFCFDIEKLLGRLNPPDQQLIKRLGLQEYTQGEAASMLGLSLRNTIRLYGRALDKLTAMLLEAKMLEPQESCQGGRRSEMSLSSSF
jgi:hypothetical protein